MAIVYLGLGSNLDDRLKNIVQALNLLETNPIKILKRSTIIETEPVGGPPQGKFLNAAIKIETPLLPLELLSLLKSIENQLGRIKTVPNGPRTIDLDILLYDSIHFESDELIIPHPRMLQRDFVMAPLKEIFPEIIEELSHARH